MKRPSLSYHIMLGLLLGLFCIPAQPVQAQFTVYDPTNFALQLKKAIEETTRWIETIDHYRKQIEHYARIYNNAVEQLTNLKGILKTVDETLTKNKALIGLVNDMGRLVRGSLRLYDNLERMVLYRIRALKQIDDRLRNGIFDANQNKRDFESYIRYTMGRSAQDTIARLERLARADSQLAFWLDEKQKAEIKLASLNQDLIELQKARAVETAKPASAQRDIQHLNDQILEHMTAIAELEKYLAELTKLIDERVVRYGVRIAEMENFGRQVVTVGDAWSSLMRTKASIARDLDNLVIGR